MVSPSKFELSGMFTPRLYIVEGILVSFMRIPICLLYSVMKDEKTREPFFLTFGLTRVIYIFQPKVLACFFYISKACLLIKITRSTE